MVREKFGVRLNPEERNQLEHLVRAGKSTARVSTRSRILLKTDDGWSRPRWPRRWMWPGVRSFGSSGVSPRRDWLGRCRTGPSPAVPKLDDRGEAHLIALACSQRRKGMTTGPCARWRARWWSWAGFVPVPRDGAAAPEKNSLKPCRRRSGAFLR